MVLLPDGRILLSGGATVDDKCVPVYHKDLRQLDTETMLWSKAKTTGGTHIEVYACFFVGERNNCMHATVVELHGDNRGTCAVANKRDMSARTSE